MVTLRCGCDPKTCQAEQYAPEFLCPDGADLLRAADKVIREIAWANDGDDWRPEARTSEAIDAAWKALRLHLADNGYTPTA